MFVGVARIVLQLPGARSLKERRKVVKSFKERVRARGTVSIAEIGDVERYQVARLGVAVVSGDAQHCDEILQGVLQTARTLPNAILADSASEVLPFGDGGTGVRGGIESRLDAQPFASTAGHVLRSHAVDGDDDDDDDQVEEP